MVPDGRQKKQEEGTWNQRKRSQVKRRPTRTWIQVIEEVAKKNRIKMDDMNDKIHVRNS